MKQTENLKAGFGLLGNPEDIKKRLPQMSKQELKEEFEKIQTSLIALGTEELHRQYLEIAGSPEQALNVFYADIQIINLIRKAYYASPE